VADIFTLIPGFEKGFGMVMDRFHEAVALWPAWSVTWPELRHEGDADYYRARADGTAAGSALSGASRAVRRSSPAVSTYCAAI